MNAEELSFHQKCGWSDLGALGFEYIVLPCKHTLRIKPFPKPESELQVALQAQLLLHKVENAEEDEDTVFLDCWRFHFFHIKTRRDLKSIFNPAKTKKSERTFLVILLDMISGNRPLFDKRDLLICWGLIQTIA